MNNKKNKLTLVITCYVDHIVLYRCEAPGRAVHVEALVFVELV